jgi:hypothetical protein
MRVDPEPAAIEGHMGSADCHLVEGGAEARLALTKGGSCPSLLGAVAQDLEKAYNRAGVVPQRRHHPGSPEARAVALLVPAFVGGASFRECGRHLLLRHARRPVLRREEQSGAPAQHLGTLPARDVLRAAIPFRDPAPEVGGDDGVVGRTLQDRACVSLAAREGAARP